MRDHKVTFDLKEVKKTVPAKSQEEIEDYFEDYANFHEDDNISVGDWLLFWHAKNDGLPSKNGKISWLQVHEVIPSGIIDDPHNKLVGEVKRNEKSQPPFKLGREIERDIRELIASKKYPSLIDSNEDIWKLDSTKKDTLSFLFDLRAKQKSSISGVKKTEKN